MSTDTVLCVADSIEIIENYLKLDCKQIGTIISTDLFQYKYEDDFNGFLVYQIMAFNKKSNKFASLFDYKLHVGFMNVVDPEDLDYTPY
jgi:hypothetical protein